MLRDQCGIFRLLCAIYKKNEAMYLRFVVGSESDSARIQSGLFTEVEYFRCNGLLESYQDKLVKEIFTYFNENLHCPPYSKRIGQSMQFHGLKTALQNLLIR